MFVGLFCTRDKMVFDFFDNDFLQLDVGGASGGDNDVDLGEHEHLSDTDLALDDDTGLNEINDIEMNDENPDELQLVCQE